MIGIKTIIADNQLMFVEGLTACLEKVENPALKIVGLVENAEELLEVLERKEANLLLMELNLPDVDGLTLIPDLRAKFPELKICIVTSYGESRFVKDAFQKGVDGYILKSHEINHLLEGISEIMDGYTFLADGLRITPVNRKKNGHAKRGKPTTKYQDRFLIRQKLTRREQEVLRLITQAKNNREIADMLYISDQTVGVHRKNIMRKLGIKNTLNLIKFAIENQIV